MSAREKKDRQKKRKSLSLILSVARRYIVVLLSMSCLHTKAVVGAVGVYFVSGSAGADEAAAV